jgi:membrane carboxypeptidase/penicillin-binding protein
MKKIIKRLFLFIAAAAAIFFIYLLFSVPNISNYTYREPTSTQVISTDGVVIGEISGKNTTYVTREEFQTSLFMPLSRLKTNGFIKTAA